eukprot:m.158107 g.158107  ORF g.158107 m.158107 type:complete len:324 (+) comp14337_c2_seq2:220-1191(+)
MMLSSTQQQRASMPSAGPNHGSLSSLRGLIQEAVKQAYRPDDTAPIPDQELETQRKQSRPPRTSSGAIFRFKQVGEESEIPIIAGKHVVAEEDAVQPLSLPSPTLQRSRRSSSPRPSFAEDTPMQTKETVTAEQRASTPIDIDLDMDDDELAFTAASEALKAARNSSVPITFVPTRATPSPLTTIQEGEMKRLLDPRLGVHEHKAYIKRHLFNSKYTKRVCGHLHFLDDVTVTADYRESERILRERDAQVDQCQKDMEEKRAVLESALQQAEEKEKHHRRPTLPEALLAKFRLKKNRRKRKSSITIEVTGPQLIPTDTPTTMT